MKWSPSEKKIARAAYDAAVEAALARILVEFKRQAEAAKEPADMWAVETYLRDARREIDDMFEYSYSRLLVVFGYALRKGYLTEHSLAGLGEDKLAVIRELLASARWPSRT